jgi:hypothetical protein
MLSDPRVSRCPQCHKKLDRRDRPIVLGDKKRFGTKAPTEIDLIIAERAERAQASFNQEPVVLEAPPIPVPTAEAPPAFAAPPYVPAPPAAAQPEPIQHTTIFEPSQFDPEMRQVLDSLYRKARSEPDELP